MAKNTSFSVGDHFSAYVERQVKQGRCSNASNVVRARLRLLEENEARVAAFRQAVLDGMTSVPSTPFDFDAFIERKRADFEKLK